MTPLCPKLEGKHCIGYDKRKADSSDRDISTYSTGVLRHSDWSDAHHPLRPVIKLGLRNPRKNRQKVLLKCEISRVLTTRLGLTLIVTPCSLVPTSFSFVNHFHKNDSAAETVRGTDADAGSSARIFHSTQSTTFSTSNARTSGSTPEVSFWRVVAGRLSLVYLFFVFCSSFLKKQNQVLLFCSIPESDQGKNARIPGTHTISFQ